MKIVRVSVRLVAVNFTSIKILLLSIFFSSSSSFLLPPAFDFIFFLISHETKIIFSSHHHYHYCHSLLLFTLYLVGNCTINIYHIASAYKNGGFLIKNIFSFVFNFFMGFYCLLDCYNLLQLSLKRTMRKKKLIE